MNKKERIAAQQQADSLMKQIAQAHEQEQRIIDETIKEIDQILERKNLFGGVILTPDMVSQIVKLAIETKEPVKMSYNVYLKE